jgi:DNA-binding Lrp family transcriptional regulator
MNVKDCFPRLKILRKPHKFNRQHISGAQMPEAYVLAKIEIGKDKQTLETIKKLAGATEVTFTYGAYDLHAKVKFDTMEELDEFIFEKIRKIDGIKETMTLVVPDKVI